MQELHLLKVYTKYTMYKVQITKYKVQRYVQSKKLIFEIKLKTKLNVLQNACFHNTDEIAAALKTSAQNVQQDPSMFAVPVNQPARTALAFSGQGHSLKGMSL